MRDLQFTVDNHLTLLHGGAAYFPALIEAIDAARTEIFFETYIFSPDATGTLVLNALVRAAARGVQVHVITDWIGTGPNLTKLLDREFQVGGVLHRSFNSWFRRGVARSHRKLCVIDLQYAFVGGLNIIDDLRYDYNVKLTLPAPRWDFAVQVEGPLVGLIHQEAEAQWERIGKMPLYARFEMYRDMRTKRKITIAKVALAGFVVRDNFRNRRTIQRAYLRAIGNARKSVLLATPYFAPGRKFLNALATAAARGVEVTLLIGAGEFRVQDAVANAFYPKLLKSGATVYEFSKTQMHGKVAVIDDEWATVGSSNCDGLSLFLNHEANVVVRDADFARELRKHIEDGVAQSVAIRQEDFSNIPWYKRLWHSAAYLLYKAVLRTITLGDYS